MYITLISVLIISTSRKLFLFPWLKNGAMRYISHRKKNFPMFHFNFIFDKPPTIYAGVILYFLFCIIRKLNNLKAAT